MVIFVYIRGLHYIIGQSPQVFPFVYQTALANIAKNTSGYTMKNSWSEVKSSSKITITGWNLTKVMVKEKVQEEFNVCFDKEWENKYLV